MSVLAAGSNQPPATAAHPLDPLSAAELEAVVRAIRADGRLSDVHRFCGAALDDDAARGALRAAPEDAPPPRRRVRVEVRDALERRSWTVGVVLEEGDARCDEWTDLGDQQPLISLWEARAAQEACKADPAFRAALARRGIDDVSIVAVDAESIGGFVPERWAGRRLAWGSCWHRESLDDNAYARPIGGVVPLVDLDTMEVLEVEDDGVVPMATEAGTYAPGAWGPERPGLRALEIEQPDGPSFAVDGWEVRWQGWQLRLGFSYREGLVLRDVAFEQDGELRPVLHRAAASEMYVPYLESSNTQYRKNFFDWGEYGAGPLTNSLALGCDCLGHIHYFTTAVLDGDGTARELPNAICMHEEDDGVLWKHHNSRTGTTEVRRSRKLVISSFATFANYDYGFYWELFQDGSIELDVVMTGILSAGAVPPGEVPPHGRLVAPGVQATNHQHYFALRLDMAVDGPRTRLQEVHAESEPDPALDPWGNAVRTVRTTLASERDAARSNDPSRAVHWRVESADRRNRFDEPTAYRVHVADTARPFARPDSVSARRAPFTHRHLWGTAYAADERYAGGELPNQAEPGADGVHRWQEADRPLDGAELVLWPVLGSHHAVRPEDWPVMPAAHARLRLEPDGFFDRNPALDVAPPTPAGDHCCHHHGGTA